MTAIESTALKTLFIFAINTTYLLLQAYRMVYWDNMVFDHNPHMTWSH